MDNFQMCGKGGGEGVWCKTITGWKDHERTTAIKSQVENGQLTLHCEQFIDKQSSTQEIKIFTLQEMAF